MKKLYFIAIYPPKEIIEEVKVFKRDLAIYYDNSKALKNEAHITLFPPFSREVELESDIHIAFQKINTAMDPFDIELNGFGSFPNPKSPVLFIQPEESIHLTELYHSVKQQFNFAKYSFTPHMTVGYRDLTWENYLKAWEKYKEQEYQTKFLVDKILLLRHEGRWVPIAEKKLGAN
ncbi:RNA 2',3'-cyclic phosphodiesterase [Chryseobacterium phosphatilyticum]|uniref:RNA 2',3'-cyclic phosphodiesterase n=1 Tax=Chryseobacterium phosphatilyticum TaxID=475075 RepID=A0A316X8G7_9FLAO|nr:2'-5' RNA ligase family protein [Chryseobacterium phosphatilyticum]PWN69844.1 RNA 2',3'-cyclic phosphodiesterase [Chryseobacterium phosphatilyticum]